MRILLTNDDGINAEGIRAFKSALREIADVTVVAPETEMSAVGHSITLSDPLRVREVRHNGEPFGLAVNGTPADCVKIAVRAILPQPPDMVVSGINHGQNVATNIIYSGTVSAATEGTILGIPSVAVSLASFTGGDFSMAADYSIRVIKQVAARPLPPDTLVNVNVPAVPADQVKGIKVCRMGMSKFTEVFERRVDPRNREYFWQGGQMEMNPQDVETDINWLSENWVTVTPIHYDLTHYELMEDMLKWKING
ncbi:MAG: 5'/3'-nucleotidase SurE [Nitrospinota bacterium]|nr:5'/3'-nucleotidase SurE [Nitrospinota bacterium]